MPLSQNDTGAGSSDDGGHQQQHRMNMNMNMNITLHCDDNENADVNGNVMNGDDNGLYGDVSSGGSNSISLLSIEQNQSTGRWTKEEHNAFLSGLQMFGKEWKKVASRVGTRTVVQTR